MELLERQEALGELDAHLALAARGSGRVVLLHGEAGVGKTAVVREFAERAARAVGAACAGSSVRVLLGACDPLTTPRPLGPVTDFARLLGEPLQARLAAEHGSGDVFAALLADLSEHGTSLLVFEDVHWADQATLDLLRYLARRIADAPALLVATYQDEGIGPTHPLAVVLGDLAPSPNVHRLTLRPLSRAAVARLAADRALDVEELHRVTGGNPFFVTEILAAGGGLIPATVREAVVGRLARLTLAGRETVEAAAVVGARAAPWLVEEAVLETESSLAECLAAGVLQLDGEQIVFRHELARMLVLDEIPGYRRVAMHQAVLEALRSRPPDPGDLADLAYHAEEAGDESAVLIYARRAARHAAALRAHREAAAQYQRVLRHGSNLPADDRADLLEGRSYECYLTNHVPEAITARREALELRRAVGDQLREGDDRRWLSRMLWLMGRSAEADRQGHAALHALSELAPSPEHAWAYANLAHLAALAQRPAEATRYARQAAELGRRLGDPEVVVRAGTYAAMARLFSTGEGWEELEAARRTAAERGMEEQAALAAVMLAMVAVVHRDLPRARAAADWATRYCLDHDLMSFLHYADGLGAAVLLHSGDWDRAAEVTAAQLAHPAVPPVARSAPLTVLALVRARRGDGEVWPLLDEAVELAEPTDLLRSGPVRVARAEAAWLAGDEAAALAEAEAGLRAVTPDSDPWMAGTLARWARRAGAAPDGIRGVDAPALELAGDWAAAARRWDGLGCPYDAALARLDGDDAALRRSAEALRSLGAGPAAERAEALLRRRHRPSRGPAAENPDGLTGREQEVLELLKRGLTDAEIGAALFISRRTASHHVAAILHKLGLASRRQVAAPGPYPG